MLRRLRFWLIRLLTGQGEHERLARLLDLLRRNGVTEYRAAGLRLQLAPLEPERPSAPLPRTQLPTDAELLFGEPEANLKRQGLL